MGRKKKDYSAAVDSLNPDVDSDGEDMELDELGFGEDEAVDVSKKDEPVDADAPTSEAPSDATGTAATQQDANEVSPAEAPADPLAQNGVSSGDGASEDAAKKPEDVISAEPSQPATEQAPAPDATASTPADEGKETVSTGDVAYPGTQDMADLSIKDADGKQVEGTGTPLPPDAEPNSVPEAAEDAADEAQAPEAEPEAAEAPAEAPEPVDPASLPGMAPCATVGELEAAGAQPKPMTAIEGLGKDDSVPALGEVQDAAKPIEDALDGDVLGQLKDAGNTVSDAMLQLKGIEQDLDKLPPGARALAVQVMSMGLHFISALESIFKRQ